MKMLRVGGSAAIVIKNTFLSNVDNATTAIRKELLQNYNLHTILDLPNGVFGANSSTGVKTVVLFFDKGQPTQNIWYYQLNVGRNMGKTNPLIEADLADFLVQYGTKADSSNSWTVNMSDADKITFDLSVKNSNAALEPELRTPSEIIEEIQVLDKEATAILKELV